jgi:glycolate oxidase iron-sulfur subunit
MAAAAVPAPQPVHDVVDYNLLFDCVHCGLCLEACPTYLVARTEMDSPRGRIYLMKSLAEGALELDPWSASHLDLCLGCRGCETACPSGVHYGRLIEDARSYVETHYRRPRAERLRHWLVGQLFPHPARLRVLVAPLKLAERLGLRPVIERLAPAATRRWLELLPPLAARRPLAADALDGQEAPEAGSVVVHHGCVTQVLAASENINSERLLRRAGYRVLKLSRTGCCGALDLHAGEKARALRLARANVAALKQCGAQAIISAASGCAAAMAEYGELLKHDPQLADDAREVAARVTDLSSLLLKSNRPLGNGARWRVTYHDSCHLAHGLRVREQPRQLLRSIPGVELIEMADADLCCGSAGSYNLTQPEMSRTLARRKVDNILATAADYVVMGNPGCEFQVAGELRRRNAPVRVMHLADFLALATK